LHYAQAHAQAANLTVQWEARQRYVVVQAIRSEMDLIFLVRSVQQAHFLPLELSRHALNVQKILRVKLELLYAQDAPLPQCAPCIKSDDVSTPLPTYAAVQANSSSKARMQLAKPVLLANSQ